MGWRQVWGWLWLWTGVAAASKALRAAGMAQPAYVDMCVCAWWGWEGRGSLQVTRGEDVFRNCHGLLHWSRKSRLLFMGVDAQLKPVGMNIPPDSARWGLGKVAPP